MAELEPDLVVNTGDNLAHPRAVPAVLAALGPLLDRPGLFVFGSNDYYGPTFKNPARYLWKSTKRQPRRAGCRGATCAPPCWNAAGSTPPTPGSRWTAGGLTVAAAGVDDPHIRRDRYDRIAGRAHGSPDLRLGLTHSPEPRVLDGFAADGYDLVLAGHTHGGQLRLPGLRRDRHQLRHRPLPRPRRLPVGRAHVAARLRRPGHLALPRRSASPARRRPAC